MEIEKETKEDEILEMLEIFDKKYETDTKIMELTVKVNEASAKFIFIKYTYFNFDGPNEWRRATTKAHQEYDIISAQ